IGTAGIAVQVVGSNWPKPHYTLLITGLCRFRVSNLLKERPFVLAEVTASFLFGLLYCPSCSFCLFFLSV
ncbi:Lon protease-like protein 2, partial [Xenotaenia resolanae]